MRTLNLAVAIAALAFAAPALAGHGKGKDKQEDAGHSRPEFSENERDQINGYFRKNPEARKQLPPGLAKKNKLPPGWQKKLAPGQRIPDDVWSHRVALPREVKLPDEIGVIRVRIDDRIVKVAEKTREVLDVLNLPYPSPTRSSPPR